MTGAASADADVPTVSWPPRMLRNRTRLGGLLCDAAGADRWRPPSRPVMSADQVLQDPEEDRSAAAPNPSFTRARAVHLLTLAAAGVFLLAETSSHWFYLDEWDYLANRGIRLGGRHGVFFPHNEHWTTIPIVIWRAIFDVVGVPRLLALRRAPGCGAPRGGVSPMAPDGSPQRRSLDSHPSGGCIRRLGRRLAGAPPRFPDRIRRVVALRASGRRVGRERPARAPRRMGGPRRHVLGHRGAYGCRSGARGVGTSKAEDRRPCRCAARFCLPRVVRGDRRQGHQRGDIPEQSQPGRAGVVHLDGPDSQHGGLRRRHPLCRRPSDKRPRRCCRRTPQRPGRTGGHHIGVVCVCGIRETAAGGSRKHELPGTPTSPSPFSCHSSASSSRLSCAIPSSARSSCRDWFFSSGPMSCCFTPTGDTPPWPRWSTRRWTPPHSSSVGEGSFPGSTRQEVAARSRRA